MHILDKTLLTYTVDRTSLQRSINHDGLVKLLDAKKPMRVLTYTHGIVSLNKYERFEVPFYMFSSDDASSEQEAYDSFIANVNNRIRADLYHIHNLLRAPEDTSKFSVKPNPYLVGEQYILNGPKAWNDKGHYAMYASIRYYLDIDQCEYIL